MERIEFRRWKTAMLVGGVALALAVVAVIAAVDTKALGRAWDRAAGDPTGVLVACAAFGSAFVLRAFAWCRVVPGLSIGHSLAGIHLAFGANHLLPLRLGEPLRVLSVVRRTSVSLEAATVSTVALRAADIATVVGLGWLIAPRAFSRLVGGWGWFLVVLVLLVGIVAWRMLRKISLIDLSQVRLPDLATFTFTVMAWLLEAVLIWQCAQWADIALSPFDAVLVTTVAVSAQIVAVAPGGFGTYEAASVAAYAVLGHGAGDALVAALAAHALKTAYSLVVGGVAVWWPRPGVLGRFRLPGVLPPVPDPGPPVTDDAPVLLFMPALNEEESVGRCVARAPREVCGRRVEVLVIDDGSNDRTADVARAANARVESFPVCRGLGAGVRYGLAAGVAMGAAAVAFCDADEEYPPEELENLVAPILSGEADYVVGSRFAGTIQHMRPHRRFGNKVLTYVLSLVARRKITDGQSGYRAFSPEAAKAADVVHDFNYAQVITLDLLAKGFRYMEVPISYRFRTTGDSFVKLGRYLRKVVPAVYRELNIT